MRPINELQDLLSDMPGIGPRQARRIIQFLLAKTPAYRELLLERIKAVGKQMSQCAQCFRYDTVSVDGACSLCSNGTRDHETLMVVERDIDIEAVESSGAYSGVYFVLGGLMSMTKTKRSGLSPRTKELGARIAHGDVREIIFALSTTPEGDYTATELAKELSTQNSSLKTTLLGRGLSVGAEIEYADAETLRSALKNRS